MGALTVGQQDRQLPGIGGERFRVGFKIIKQPGDEAFETHGPNRVGVDPGPYRQPLDKPNRWNKVQVRIAIKTVAEVKSQHLAAEPIPISDPHEPGR